MDLIAHLKRNVKSSTTQAGTVPVLVPVVRRDDGDRRRKHRFPLALPFTCGGNGSGFTVNVSSSGILADFDRVMNLGASVVMHVEWPARLLGARLQWIVYGTVLRGGRRAVVGIRKYEFRTMAPAAVRPERRVA